MVSRKKKKLEEEPKSTYQLNLRQPGLCLRASQGEMPFCRAVKPGLVFGT